MLSRVALRAVARPVTFVPVRHSHGRFKEQEQAMERDFINRTERELIANLIKKMEKTIDPQDNIYRDTLKAVLAKHDITGNEELINDLIQWKRTSI